MVRSLGAKAAAVILACSATLSVGSGPAGAIQTTTWGIQPGPSAAGPRPSLSYPSNGQTVHDSVIVYNQTAQTQIINLAVLDATPGAGTYKYTDAREGLAASVSLAAERIPLPPHEQAKVPVTIRMPRDSQTTALAAIAATGAYVNDGALLIQQRLVILVKATPSTAAPAMPDLGVWGPSAGVLLAGVAVMAVLQVRKRSRTRTSEYPHAVL